MDEFEELHNDKIFVVKNGERTGPFRATCGNGKILTHNMAADFEDGDTIVRVVGANREEYYSIVDCGYHPGIADEIPPSYNARVTKSTAPKPSPRSVTNTFNTNFHAAVTGAQIGENNRMELNMAVEQIAAVIDASTATPEKKAEAKGMLAKVLTSDAFTGIVGALSKGAVDSLIKG